MKEESARLLERARGWLEELRELDNAASQVSRLGLMTALGVVAALLLPISLVTVLDPSLGLTTVHGFVTAVGVGAALWVVWRRPRAGPPVGVGLVLLCGAMMAWAAWDNGLMPFTLLPGVVALFHLVIRPSPALWASLVVTGAMLIALFSRHANVNEAVLLRVLVTTVASVVFWQLSTRFWRRLMGRMRALGTEMAEAVAQLDTEREQARRLAEEALIEGQLAKQALKVDVATNLLNRQGFIEALDQRLLALRPDEPPLQGLVVALRLQAWNDATVYRDAATQEALLQILVARLRSLQGPGALLARSGPDTYLAWQPLVAGTLEEAFESYAVSAGILATAVTSGSTSAPTQPRTGVSLAPEDGTDGATLIAHAELACVAAVRLEQARPVRYSASLLADARSRDQLVEEMAQGLARGEFELFYQPLVSPQDARLRKAEGLIRWRHPVRGLVPPGAYIPLAEQSELIIGITDWVLAEAVRQVKIWRDSLHPAFQISVNMPPAYLGLCVREPGRMLEHLQSLQMPPGAVVLEITEGVMLEVTTELLQVLSLLRALGFQIALDDFGVGYSSFGQIDKLKLDFLKLDKSFVDDLGTRVDRGPICEAIVTMAHRLGFKVVAEGVETEVQRAHLVHMGTDYLQGYLYSKPVPAADLEAWVARQGTSALPLNPAVGAERPLAA